MLDSRSLLLFYTEQFSFQKTLSQWFLFSKSSDYFPFVGDVMVSYADNIAEDSQMHC